MRVLKTEIVGHFDSTSKTTTDTRRSVYSVDFQPNGNRMATGGGDCHVKIWNTDALLSLPESAEVCLLATLSDHSKSVNVVRWSKDGVLLASGSDDNCILVYNKCASRPQQGAFGKSRVENKENWSRCLILRGHSMDILDLDWSTNGILASASIDNKIMLWNAKESATAAIKSFTQVLTPSLILTGHQSNVKGISFDPAGRYLISSGADNLVLVWDCENNFVNPRELVEPLKHSVDKTIFRRLSWAPNGQSVCISSALKSHRPVAMVLQRNVWSSVADLVGHSDSTVCSRFCPVLFKSNVVQSQNSSDGRSDNSGEENNRYASSFLVAIGDQRGVLSIWAESEKKPIYVIRELDKGAITDISWTYQICGEGNNNNNNNDSNHSSQLQQRHRVVLACCNDKHVFLIVFEHDDLFQTVGYNCDGDNNGNTNGHEHNDSNNNISGLFSGVIDNTEMDSIFMKLYGKKQSECMTQLVSQQPSLATATLTSSSVRNIHMVSHDATTQQVLALQQQQQTQRNDGKKRIRPLLVQLTSEENSPSGNNPSYANGHADANVASSNSINKRSKILDGLDGTLTTISLSLRNQEILALVPSIPLNYQKRYCQNNSDVIITVSRVKHNSSLVSVVSSYQCHQLISTKETRKEMLMQLKLHGSVSGDEQTSLLWTSVVLNSDEITCLRYFVSNKKCVFHISDNCNFSNGNNHIGNQETDSTSSTSLELLNGILVYGTSSGVLYIVSMSTGMSLVTPSLSSSMILGSGIVFVKLIEINESNNHIINDITHENLNEFLIAVVTMNGDIRIYSLSRHGDVCCLSKITMLPLILHLQLLSKCKDSAVQDVNKHFEVKNVYIKSNGTVVVAVKLDTPDIEMFEFHKESDSWHRITAVDYSHDDKDDDYVTDVMVRFEDAVDESKVNDIVMQQVLEDKVMNLIHTSSNAAREVNSLERKQLFDSYCMNVINRTKFQYFVALTLLLRKSNERSTNINCENLIYNKRTLLLLVNNKYDDDGVIREENDDLISQQLLLGSNNHSLIHGFPSSVWRSLLGI